VRARLMQTEVGMPLLKIVRVIHDPEARPVQYITVTMTPERSRILMDIPGETVNTLSAGHFVHEVPRAR
ncbi:MAG: GntR family transcriptional regulator, partial [Proteobacteria bacterium]|nr:GntR family transcriptional regulator [Pseudomonadota bacterium]